MSTSTSMATPESSLSLNLWQVPCCELVLHEPLDFPRPVESQIKGLKDWVTFAFTLSSSMFITAIQILMFLTNLFIGSNTIFLDQRIIILFTSNAPANSS